MIIGSPIDGKMLPYSYILNGPIDADKLDYLSRDSACTKVPIAVDIARLIQKLDVVTVDKRRFVKPPLWNDNSSHSTYFTIAIKHSAQRVFLQLSMARSIMYESVYVHHKVLTAETMFRRALDSLSSIIAEQFTGFDKLLSLTDDAFNEFTISSLVSPEMQNSKNAGDWNSITSQIWNRELMKRVASISLETIVANNVHYDRFVDNIMEDEFTDEYKTFYSKLTSEYRRICGLLELPLQDSLPQFAFIEASTFDEPSEMDIPIEYGDSTYKMSSKVFKNRTWMQSKENKQKQYYLVTDQRHRDAVYLALEKVLDEYSINMRSEAIVCSKYKNSHISALKKRLLEKSYYNNCLSLIDDSIFQDMIDIERFESVIEKFRSFNGVNHSTVTAESLMTYLKQFLSLPATKEEIESIIDGVLRILCNAKYIDRPFF